MYIKLKKAMSRMIDDDHDAYPMSAYKLQDRFFALCLLLLV
jgi:hypothetical protein